MFHAVIHRICIGCVLDPKMHILKCFKIQNFFFFNFNIILRKVWSLNNF